MVGFRVGWFTFGASQLIFAETLAKVVAKLFKVTRLVALAVVLQLAAAPEKVGLAAGLRHNLLRPGERVFFELGRNHELNSEWSKALRVVRAGGALAERRTARWCAANRACLVQHKELRRGRRVVGVRRTAVVHRKRKDLCARL